MSAANELFKFVNTSVQVELTHNRNTIVTFDGVLELNEDDKEFYVVVSEANDSAMITWKIKDIKRIELLPTKRPLIVL